MDNENGDAQEVAETPALPPSPPEPTPRARKQLPQRNVDAFWNKFTTKYPGKVHSILPADIYAKIKASKATKGVVSGQVAVKSYDQAVSECRNAVEKIATECRRVNLKYRDPHFDIEWDLKRYRRDCLDGLGRDGDDDDGATPKSVKRIPDIFDKPVFFQEGATASDVRQGMSGDCWFMSALCALCNKKGLIEKVCVARDEVVGVYGFVFHRDGEWSQTIIDDKLYLIASDWWESSDEEKHTFEMVNRQDAEERYRLANQTGSRALYFAQCASENETWLPLLEKAFAKAHGDFGAINGGFTGEAIEDLTGGVTTELFTTDILDKEKFWNEEIMKVNDEFLFGCATGTFDKWQGSDLASMIGARNDIVRMHAYSIQEAREIKGERLCRLRNPWGSGEWKGAWSDGSEQWTPEWMELLGHKFGDDGMFWISFKDLLRRYQTFDRTRLFGPEWRITQQWTEVDVPWSADYNDTKFKVTLTKRSPIVIVLSQLDDRYFKGLEGQYTFQLHFRLEKDGEHDYIVRSHGNYSMHRSVSTDLELEAGTYSVLMKITARRWPGESVPEDVIRNNVKFRQEKLIQVGLAYDLAHAKGDIRETEEEKAERQKQDEKTKAADKKKQRATKSKSNRKQWEYGRREKAREKRHHKRRDAFNRKKAEAEAQQAAEKHDGDATREGAAEEPTLNGTNAAADSENKSEKQACAGATEDATGEHVPDPDSFPTPPAEPQPNDIVTNGAAKPAQSAEAQPDHAPAKAALDKTPQASSPLSEANVRSIPEVTLNGDPVPASTAAAPASNPAAPSSLAPNDDDYQYDSDASYVSSVDSVLDFYPDKEAYATAALAEEDATAQDHEDDSNGDDDDDTPPADATAADDPDAEFENDPWNAVCVVGLRVYSQDDGCCVQIIRPKKVEEKLDLDDQSKGVSGEVDGKKM